MEQITTFIAELAPWIQSLIGLVALAVAAIAVNFLVKRVILRAAAPILDERSQTADRAAARFANALPLLIISRGIMVVPHLPQDLVTLVTNVAEASIALSIALGLSQALSYADEVYRRRPDAHARPIKGYIQVLKIAVFSAAAILMISILINESPLLLLSGLGAMAAVLLLVFKDTILSLVASVQLTSNDMLRVGDWIEMPGMHADGDVIDIALHTVKIQNFDKTITTIPTHKLISESYRNWRGMSESGGRRIKRSISIDQNLIRFLTNDEVKNLNRFRVLRDYLAQKEQEITDWNKGELGDESNSVNARRLTNIGTLRAYIIGYLKSHPMISKEFTLLVRQLPSGPTGLPIEIYCFTATTDWGQFERIMADIFDHLLAILPEFDLKIFQEPSGSDIRLINARAAA